MRNTYIHWLFHEATIVFNTNLECHLPRPENLFHTYETGTLSEDHAWWRYKMSEWKSDYSLMPNDQLFSYFMAKKSYNFEKMMMMMMMPFCTRPTCLGFYSAGSLRQQAVGRHATPLEQNNLIPSQPIFPLTPKWCLLSGEATHIKFIVFGFTRPGF